MEGLFRKHVVFWTDRKILTHLGVSFILFLLSLFFTYVAATYVHSYTGYVVPDILLDNLPIIIVVFIFFQGAALFIFILCAIGVYEPKHVPFTLESTALFFGRRLKEGGVMMSGIRYAINFFWVSFFKKPFTKTHKDICV